MSAFLAWLLGGKKKSLSGPDSFVNTPKVTKKSSGCLLEIRYNSNTPPPPSLMRNVIVLSPSEMSKERKARVSYAIRMSHYLNTVRRVQNLC
jgi:hypothetical protein